MIKFRLATLLAFSLVIICLLPVLKTGLYTDDLFLFQTRNSVKEYTTKPFTEIAHKEVESWRYSGRYAPLSLYLMEFVYKNFTTIASYKLYVLCMNLLAVASFILLLKSFKAENLIPLFLLFYAAEIQLRLQYHDPFSAFNGMYQCLATAIFGSIACYNFSLQYKSTVYYILSILLACAAILTSEMGLCIVPLLLITAWFGSSNFRQLAAGIAPFLLVFIIYLAYVIKIRHEATWNYSGLSANLNWSDMFPVLEKQLFAALPFSNLFQQVQIPQLLIQQLNSTYNLVSIAAIVILFVITLIFILRPQKKQASGSTALIFTGILLLLTPACIIMPSAKYQHELHFGQGYLPVFIQNFGVAMLFACLAVWVLKPGKTFGRLALGSMLVVTLVSTLSAFLFNAALIRTRNYDLCNPADALYNSVKKGILNNCPSGSTIILGTDYFWRSPDIYRQIFEDTYQKKFRVLDADGFNPANRAAADTSQGCFLLECPKADTLYTRLYKLDCSKGNKLQLLRCDTTLQNIRLSELEKPILLPRE